MERAARYKNDWMQTVHIDDRNVDSAIRALRDGRDQPIPASISLGASVELAAWERGAQIASASMTLQDWGSRNLFLQESMRFFGGKASNSPYKSGRAQTYEFYPIRSREDIMMDYKPWELFLGCFQTALKGAGFGKLSYALAGALSEMASNVPDHSTIGEPERSVNGLVAYTVSPKQMTFTVGDDGVGALRSLNMNPVWQCIKRSREALYQIARSGASRRIGQGRGQGYNELFTALSSFNGLVRLRSGDGIFELRGSLGQCVPQGANGPKSVGLQLTVECRL